MDIRDEPAWVEPMMTYFTRLVSPIGEILLTSNGQALTGLYLEEFSGGPAPVPSAGWVADAGPFAEARAQLRAYFAGERPSFSLALAPSGTAFQRAVWDALTAIPFGATCSYGELAARLGRPGAARAVGSANGCNPIAIVIPCHRVIGADGSLTGYGGGLPRKRWLLEHEGVRFSGDLELFPSPQPRAAA